MLGIGIFLIAGAIVLILLRLVLRKLLPATPEAQTVFHLWPADPVPLGSMSQGALPQQPPPNPEASIFTHQPIYLADFVRTEATIKGKTFENWRIFGPAVIVPKYGSWPFYEGTWGEAPDLDSVLWPFLQEYQEGFVGIVGKQSLVGVIGIETDVTFGECPFVRVGIVAPPERVKNLKGSAANQ